MVVSPKFHLGKRRRLLSRNRVDKRRRPYENEEHPPTQDGKDVGGSSLSVRRQYDVGVITLTSSYTGREVQVTIHDNEGQVTLPWCD